MNLQEIFLILASLVVILIAVQSVKIRSARKLKLQILKIIDSLTGVNPEVKDYVKKLKKELENI
jgi:hypothetical protein